MRHNRECLIVKKSGEQTKQESLRKINFNNNNVSYENIPIEEDTPGCYVKTRYVLGLMTALGTLNLYSLRNGINVAIVAMVMTSNYGTTNITRTNTSTTCLNCSNLTTAQEMKTNRFHWTLLQQTSLLGCYYYGYCITNLPGAWLTKRFGIRLVLGLTSLLASILTLLTPLAAHSSFCLVVVLRTMIGFLQGVTFPAAMTGWGIWAPPLERSRLIATTYSGVATGVFIVYPFVGLLIGHFGWESVFYVTGAFGFAYSLVFLVVVHDSPALHPRISNQERDYIEISIYGQKNPEQKKVIPWSAIATSLPVWANISAHLSANWTTITMTMLVPLYIAKVYGFDVESVGFLAAVPFLISFLFTCCGSLLTDFVLKRKWAKTVVMRKVMSSLPLSVVGCSLLVLANVDRLPWNVVVGLGAVMGVLGLGTSGHVCSFIDIAPRYAGIIYSLSNTLVAVMGFVSPQLAGFIIHDETSASSWQGVFWLSAIICLCGAVMFGLFASDQVQPWAKLNYSSRTCKAKMSGCIPLSCKTAYKVSGKKEKLQKPFGQLKLLGKESSPNIFRRDHC